MKEAFAPRDRSEELERLQLSARACVAADTKGRDRYEEPDPLRTVFQQDRERLATSAAFQRLNGVTAGLPLVGSPSALQEAVSVAQVSRALARSLRLNEDLSEAIALGRDVGQPPFGAVGRAALSGIADIEFDPGEQSLRVVEHLSVGGRGLNLTFEARDGIVHHAAPGPMSLEGELVATVARFHLLSGELDRALAAGIAHAADVPTAVRTLGPSHLARITAFSEDIVSTSVDEPRPAGSERLASIGRELEQWRTERLESHPDVLAAAERAIHCLRSIAVYYRQHPGALPESCRGDEPLGVRVVDALCLLTDAGAVALFERLFLPSPQRD